MDRHQLGTTTPTKNNIDTMAKMDSGDDSNKEGQIADIGQKAAAAAASAKSQLNRSSSYTPGPMLTCLSSCILFIVLIQLVDCRHHDLNNVINTAPTWALHNALHMHSTSLPICHNFAEIAVVVGVVSSCV